MSTSNATAATHLAPIVAGTGSPESAPNLSTVKAPLPQAPRFPAPQPFTSLHLANLSSCVTDKKFRQMFVGFSLKKYKLFRVQEGSTARYAVAFFRCHEDAVRALEHWNYATLGGKIVRIRPNLSEKDALAQKAAARWVAIRGLPANATEQSVYTALREHGLILSLKILRLGDDHYKVRTRRPIRGIGNGKDSPVPSAASATSLEGCDALLKYPSEGVTKTLIDVMNGKSLLGENVLWEAWEAPEPQTVDTYTEVCVKGLREDVAEFELEGFFSEFGCIQEIKIGSAARGGKYAYVRYETHAAAVMAVDGADGKSPSELVEVEGKLRVLRKMNQTELRQERAAAAQRVGGAGIPEEELERRSAGKVW